MRAPSLSPAEQLKLLRAVELCEPGQPQGFDERLRANGCRALTAQATEVFQINLGRICNMQCRHCHVGAGPDRTETMDRATADACLAALDASGASTLDLTGGAPELQPQFRHLVDAAVARGLHVIDRCNLTVLLEPGQQSTPAWLAERGVEVVGSLPHVRARNTDAQRGPGAFDRSIEALRRLNAAGYGTGDPARILTLMINPAGAFLAGDQAALEADYKRRLQREHGVRFDRLIALNNMPIARFLDWLIESDNLTRYLQKLSASFNPATVAGLMCRNTLSVGHDGRIYDCDFNQMLDIQAMTTDDRPATVSTYSPETMTGRPIRTARHCYGCTAGAGSSCGGATAG